MEQCMWVYLRSFWNSSWSTSSNGWSQATIHSSGAAQISLGPSFYPVIKVLENIQTSKVNFFWRLAAAHWFWSSNTWTIIIEAFSRLTRYSAALVGSRIFLPEAKANSSSVGSVSQSLSTRYKWCIAGKCVFIWPIRPIMISIHSVMDC